MTTDPTVAVDTPREVIRHAAKLLYAADAARPRRRRLARPSGRVNRSSVGGVYPSTASVAGEPDGMMGSFPSSCVG
jgi:hypothetical protein